MTQEEKQLLLIDLCARLPYHPLLANQNNSEVKGALVQINSSEIIISPWGKYNIEEFKPYLRPMSSMTEEEWKEYDWFIKQESDELIRFRNTLKFYNKHHIDYNGLIEKDLAIEAPKDMYK